MSRDGCLSGLGRHPAQKSTASYSYRIWIRQYEPLIRREVRTRLADQRLRPTLNLLDVCQSVLNGGTREVALKFDVSESWVWRIKQEPREQGELAPKTRRSRRKVWETHADWNLTPLDRRPGFYFCELQAAAPVYSYLS